MPIPDLEPPRPLSTAARQVWDRHADRIYAEGRWQQCDRDMLALFAETTELYLRFKQDVDDHGTLVQGRTLQEKVRNPSLMGLSQARADLVRIARAVPLVHPHQTATAADYEFQSWMDELANG